MERYHGGNRKYIGDKAYRAIGWSSSPFHAEEAAKEWQVKTGLLHIVIQEESSDGTTAGHTIYREVKRRR